MHSPDEMLQKLSEVKITLGDFKRLTSYFVEDENVEERNLMPVKERTVEIVPSFSRAIPKIRVKDSRSTEFGKQLVDEALEMMNEHTSIREEEVSCHEEPSTSKYNKHQHFEHEHTTADCDQLVNESLQTTQRDCMIEKDNANDENEVNNRKQKKRDCESGNKNISKKKFKANDECRKGKGKKSAPEPYAVVHKYKPITCTNQFDNITEHQSQDDITNQQRQRICPVPFAYSLLNVTELPLTVQDAGNVFSWETSSKPSGLLQGAADSRTCTSRCVVCSSNLCTCGRDVWQEGGRQKTSPPFMNIWCLARTRDWYFAVSPVNNAHRLTK